MIPRVYWSSQMMVSFSQILQHPSSNIPRTYLVKVKEIPNEENLASLRQGIYMDNIKTNKAKIKIVNKLPKNTWLEVVLWEGRNRQIKKMFEAIGHRYPQNSAYRVWADIT